MEIPLPFRVEFSVEKVWKFRLCVVVFSFVDLSRDLRVNYGMKTNSAKFALVIAEMPKATNDNKVSGIWISFLAEVRKIVEQPKNTETLSENLWQIPLDNGLTFLGKMLIAAEKESIPMRVLILDELPAWSKYPPTQKASP